MYKRIAPWEIHGTGKGIHNRGEDEAEGRWYSSTK